MPRSGATGGAFAGDLHLQLLDADVGWLIGEGKARTNGEGFKTLARWLDGADSPVPPRRSAAADGVPAVGDVGEGGRPAGPRLGVGRRLNSEIVGRRE